MATTKAQLKTLLDSDFDWVEAVANWKSLDEWGGSGGADWAEYLIICMDYHKGPVGTRYDLQVRVYDDGGASEDCFLLEPIRQLVFRREVEKEMRGYGATLVFAENPNAIMRMQHAKEDHTDGGTARDFAIVSKVCTITHTAHGLTAGEALTVTDNGGVVDIRGNYIIQSVTANTIVFHVDEPNTGGSPTCNYVGGADFSETFVLVHKSASDDSYKWIKVGSMQTAFS